ncbi:unnamed protein product [Ectocarpus sp. 6 AP-2014]
MMAVSTSRGARRAAKCMLLFLNLSAVVDATPAPTPVPLSAPTAPANNSCLNPGSVNYKCNSSGATQIILDNCGIMDSDLDDVGRCIDVFGRDTMTRVYLRYNLLTTVRDTLFTGLGRLERIYLSNNFISEMPVATFQGLSSLQWLYLDQNSLFVLPGEIFSSLDQLERLSLHQNSLSTLHADTFAGLAGLRELSLTSNPDLQCVPANDAVTLEVDDTTVGTCGCAPAEAVMCGDGVFCIPGELGYSCGTTAPTPAPTPGPTPPPSPAPSPAPTRAKNPCLDPASEAYLCSVNGTEIHLDYCGITDDDLEDVETCLDVSGRGSMTALYVRFNYLTTIPEGLFDGLGHLEILYLNNNGLSETLSAESFQALGKLQVLNLNGNSLTALPTDLFRGLGQLRHLWINMNLLTTLPAELFDGLPQLESLDLRLNPELQCVPASTADNVETTEISSGVCGCSLAPAVLCDVGLACVPGELGFTCATSAPTPAPVLPGNNTCLDPASEHYVCGTPGTELDLAYCGITDDNLEELAACMDVFGRDAVKEVRLGYNYLTTFSGDLFHGLTHVERIFMNDNSLVSVPAEAFQGLQTLQVLNLNRNALVGIPASVFQPQDTNSTGPGHLQDIWMNMNLLSTLPAGLFDGLDMLTTLDLRLNPDLQCVPTTHDAVSVSAERLSSDVCECSPPQAAVCTAGQVCVPGEFGYTCDV